uniref:Uncharacterized protein n=1 Tax=Brassica oleracea var. oleracea TaxID=109376 RepID=A0A0D3CZL6_BRAOL
MQRYVLSGYHLKTLHYSLTHDLHSMRFLDLQGGGGSSIKKDWPLLLHCSSPFVTFLGV